MTDRANGYEEYAEQFMHRRDTHIGPDVVREWARQLPPGTEVLELGCGHGVVSKVLVEAGLKLYAVEPSPTLLGAFRERFPDVETDCSPAEDSAFFGRAFDAIVAWGVLFLMEEEAQREVLRRAAAALRPGGRLLFTAPREKREWIDILTERPSWSLGAEVYQSLLRELGCEVSSGVTDEGGNYYYEAVKL